MNEFTLSLNAELIIAQLLFVLANQSSICCCVGMTLI